MHIQTNTYGLIIDVSTLILSNGDNTHAASNLANRSRGNITAKSLVMLEPVGQDYETPQPSGTGTTPDRGDPAVVYQELEEEAPSVEKAVADRPLPQVPVQTTYSSLTPDSPEPNNRQSTISTSQTSKRALKPELYYSHKDVG